MVISINRQYHWFQSTGECLSSYNSSPLECWLVVLNNFELHMIEESENGVL